MAMCFECGKVINHAPATTRDYHGTSVSLHKACATRAAKSNITARATTCESGETYADDGEYSPLRWVYVRPGDRND